MDDSALTTRCDNRFTMATMVLIFLVPPVGVEPTSQGLERPHSIH